MDEFPNAEDEYEMLHADELEMMREFDNFDEDAAAAEAATIPPSIKRSLNFASPPPVSVKNTAIDEGIAEISQIDEIQNGGLMNRKRPADRAFDDDLDQFLNDDFMENKKKKQKPLLPNLGKSNNPQDIAKHEADLDLINRILETRKGLHRADLPDAIHTLHVCERPKHEARIYKRLPDGAFQAVTTETGERYYLTKIEEEEWDSQVNSITASHKANCLLNIPYAQLKAQAEREQIRQDERRARSLQEAEDSGMESGVEDEEVVKDTLWVEKYKPRHYLDLLSEESTNRTVLHWVKLWDKLVFGTEKKQKVKEEKKNTQNAKPFSKFQKKGPEVIEELDEQNRPMQKVILLCGPPGLGKTTLAHVIAKHAGYNVVEMNASDDRSVETFRTNLENATSMKSVLGPDPRPNCLIIDEIDGAPAPSITLLVNMLLGKDTGGKNKKGKKKEGSAMLQRPVICICNELYTPALRPLRQISLVIQFPPTHSARLAQRLLEISRKHRLRADLTVLMALCDKTENDIRSCLAFLQFVRSTKNILRLNDIDGVTLGQKDYQRSLFSVWHDIFTIPRPKKKRRGNPHEQQHENGVLLPMPDLNGDLDNFGEETTLSARFSCMLRTVQSCGEYDKLTQGWFENYPAMKIKNAAMEPVTNGLEWAAFTDIVQKEIMHSQAWTMMGFLPYACVSYHLQFASYQWPKIQFPNQMSEVFEEVQTLPSEAIGKRRLASLPGDGSSSRPRLTQWVNKDTGLDDWMLQSARDADRFTDWGFDQWDQWRRGYDALVHHLAEPIPDGKIRMNSPVCKILWDQGENARVLVVTQDGSSYLADHVLVTSSVGHLKERQASLFQPALPQKYREALAVTELGLADKVQLGWESPWWGSTNFSLNIIFTNDILGERSWLKGIMEFLTVHNQGSMLQAFVPGEYAKKMEDLPEEKVKQHLVSLLSDVTGRRITEPTFFRRIQWKKNVWMRGSYNSYVTVEGGNTIMRNNRQPLAQSVEKFGKPVLLLGGRAHPHHPLRHRRRRNGHR